MTDSDLYCTATNCSGILSASCEASYGTFSANATVECTTSSLSLSDAISLDMGYVGNHAVVFSGFVKKVETVVPENTYRITAQDTLIRAVDYFLASDDPEQPLTYHSILDRDLINGLLGQVGLSLSSGAVSPTFTYGTNEDGAKFNLQSVADAIQTVSNITGRVCYAQAGLVYYVDRKPYLVGGDTPTHFFTRGNTGNIIDISYEEASDRIRNRIVVYGKNPIHASASAGSSYVVVTQTAVLAHELIDTQALADATASVNLELLNRLGRTWTLTIYGDPSINAREIGNITEPFTTPVATDVFLYRVSHQFGEQYMTQITATA